MASREIDLVVQKLEEMKADSTNLVEQELRRAVEELFGSSFEEVAAVEGNAEILDQLRSSLNQHLEKRLDTALTVFRCRDDHE